MPTETAEQTIEYFTDPPPLPAERIIARILEDPASARAVAREIEGIQRGDFRPIELALDPLTACLVLSYLEIGMAAAGNVGTDRHLVALVVDGLAAHVGRTCPALGRVIRDARAKRGGEQ